MAPSRIGPAGSGDSAGRNEAFNGGAAGSARAQRPGDGPTRVNITGPLQGISPGDAADKLSRREVARRVTGQGLTTAARGWTKTRDGVSTAKNGIEEFGRSFGIDRRSLLKGVGYAGGAYALYRAVTWLHDELGPMPLPVPDDVPASPERIAQAQKAVFSAAGEEAKQVIATLSQPSTSRSDRDEAAKQLRVIPEAQREGGQALVAALDRFWGSDLGKTIVYTDANRALSHRLRAQIDFLKLRPTSGEAASQRTARREALENAVKALRQADWTCQPGNDRTINCSL